MSSAVRTLRTRIVKPKILYYGTPVVLLTTVNEDGTSNITPMSSAWALGNRVILGLGEGGKGLENLRRCGECVINLPDPTMWPQVEALAPLTGKNSVPEAKADQFRYEKNKFAAAGLTAIAADMGQAVRIAECPIQIEGRVVDIRLTGDPVRFAIVEVEALTVHAHEGIVSGEQHIDQAKWSPLIYNFRHYFGLGAELGKTFRAEV